MEFLYGWEKVEDPNASLNSGTLCFFLSPTAHWITEAKILSDRPQTLGRRKEAEIVYQETAAYVQKMGGFFSKNQQAWFRSLGNWMQQPEGTTAPIQSSKY